MKNIVVVTLVVNVVILISILFFVKEIKQTFEIGIQQENIYRIGIYFHGNSIVPESLIGGTYEKKIPKIGDEILGYKIIRVEEVNKLHYKAFTE